MRVQTCDLNVISYYIYQIYIHIVNYIKVDVLNILI